jgi:Fe-S-cluster containining protein
MAAEYLALVMKVESFVAQTAARRAQDLACKRGCDACCHAWLSVSEVEAEQVKAGLAALSPEQRARVRARGERELAAEQQLAQADVGGEHALAIDGELPSPRCAMLEDDGSCAIYAFRPLVCRTQGHALRYPSDFIPTEAVLLRTKSGDVTWCPLNYTGAPPRSEDVLDAERVDQILALIARRHAASDDAALTRAGLSELAARL